MSYIVFCDADLKKVPAGRTYLDARPRWICFYTREIINNGRKERETFTVKFNDLDRMIVASMRAKALGYSVKTAPVR